METYTCIIVDDSEIDQLRLQAMLRKFDAFKVIATFLSPQKALDVISELKADILFLDIQMPGISGLELRKEARNIPVCIFVSYSPEFAIESYELEALDYLVKPLEIKRFEKTIERITAYMALRNNTATAQHSGESFMVKSGTGQLRLNPASILYLEALSDFTNVITSDGKQIISHSIGTVLREAAFKSFVRIHRSFAVPKGQIHKVSSKEVILKNGQILPVGKTYKETLLQNL